MVAAAWFAALFNSQKHRDLVGCRGGGFQLTLGAGGRGALRGKERGVCVSA